MRDLQLLRDQEVRERGLLTRQIFVDERFAFNVRNNVGVRFTPTVPYLGALSQQCDVCRISHRVTRKSESVEGRTITVCNVRCIHRLVQRDSSLEDEQPPQRDSRVAKGRAYFRNPQAVRPLQIMIDSVSFPEGLASGSLLFDTFDSLRSLSAGKLKACFSCLVTRRVGKRKAPLSPSAHRSLQETVATSTRDSG